MDRKILGNNNNKQQNHNNPSMQNSTAVFNYTLQWSF